MAEDDRLIYLIGRAQHCLRMYLKQEFDRERIDITPVQSGILFLLQQEARTMTELSRALVIDNSATTRMVDRLEKAGLAGRRPHPNDRRTFLIEITREGGRAIDRAYHVVRRVNDEIKTDFSETEIDVFKSVLNRFFTKFKKAS